jgi:hypothetical protein
MGHGHQSGTTSVVTAWFNWGSGFATSVVKCSIACVPTDFTNVTSTQTPFPHALQVHGEITPVPQLTIADISFQAVKDVGLQASASASFADLNVGVVALIDAKTRAVSWTLTATNVNLKKVVSEVLSTAEVPAPEFLLNFLDTLTFNNVTITYANSSFSMMAFPEVDGNALLEKVVGVVGIEPGQICLTLGSKGFAFKSLKPLNIELPSPFVNPNTFSLDIAADLDSGDMKFLAALSTGIVVPGVDGTVKLELSAGIVGNAASAQFAGANPKALSAAITPLALPAAEATAMGGSADPGADLVPVGTAAALPPHPAAAPHGSDLVLAAAFTGDVDFSGALLSPVSIKDFPFVRLDNASATATLAVFNGEFELQTLVVDGTGTVFGAVLTAKFSYDKVEEAVGFVGSMDKLDIPQALSSVGVNAKALASAGLVLSDVRVTYATKPIAALDINAAGFFAKGSITFLKMVANVDVAVTKEGTDFYAVFDTSQLAEVRCGAIQ